MPSPMRTDEYDALRGVAAAGVVFFHIRNRELFWYWTVMDMFFILSSFLIGRLLEKKVRELRDIPAFYVRRAQRLWPAYFTGIALTYLCFLAFQASGLGPQGGAEGFWRYLTFSQYTDYYYSTTRVFDYPEYAVHLWSLAVEEHFYILYPLIYIVLRRLPPWMKVLVITAAMVGGYWARVQQMHFYLMVPHVDAFLMGAGLSMMYPQLKSRPELARPVMAVGILALIALIPYFYQGYLAYFQHRHFPGGGTTGSHAIEATLFNVFWACLVAWLTIRSGSNATRWFRVPYFTYLGRLSYSLYLLHLPVLYVFVVFADHALVTYAGVKVHHLVLCLLALPAVFGSAHLLYVLVDRRMQDSGGGALIAAENRRASAP